MNYREFQQHFEPFLVFSAADIRKEEPSFHRQRLSEWLKKGYIRKAANTQYMFATTPLHEATLFVVANAAYAPSYVSLEMALSYYGLIPEGVYSVTSVTSKKTRVFPPGVARFEYRHVKPSLMWGYRLVDGGNGRVFQMAEPEKAVLDYLYLRSDLVRPSDFEALRINGEIFREKIRIETLQRYAEHFGKQALTRRMSMLLQSLDIIT
ncbi:MAG: hypothetical protein WCL23_01975 [Candidatus Moraniibacteriota bacterium]|jgi:predicted transcriptional regulator of viral defense system